MGENNNLALQSGKLSARRQQIIRPVLANPRRFVLMSVRALAKELDTDSATMVRIVREMGFENYRAFQHHLHELSIVYATSLDTMQATTPRPNGGAGLVRQSIEQDVGNLNALRNSLDPEKVLEVARRLYSASRVLIVGGDLATSLVAFLDYLLTAIGLPVFAATGHGRILHLARTATKKDLVIAISFRRGLRMTVEGLKRARENGAYCVGISNSLVSPVVRFSDVSFITSVEPLSFGMSYVAPMALFNALVAACANVRRGRTLGLLREVDEEQRHGSRWFVDDVSVE